MSRENVEVVERLYEIWDRDGFGVVRDLMDPSIEYINPAYAVEPGTRRGYDEFALAVQSMNSIYPGRRLSPVKFYDAGSRVAVRVRVVARGAGSDVEVDSERGYVFDLRDGKVIRYAWFNDPDEALKAVGLEE